MPIEIAPVATAVGGRESQQDAVRTYVRGELAIAVVCDGIGSLPESAAWADLTADLTVDFLRGIPTHRRSIGPYLLGAPTAIHERLRHSVEHGRLGPDGGTTVAAVAIDRGIAWAITRGDSRVSLVRDGEVRAATLDDRAPVEDPNLPSRAVTRFLTAVAPDVDLPPVVVAWGVRPGDLVVVTSDGVHDVLNPGELARIVSETIPFEKSAARLVAEAVARAGDLSDNATAVVVRIVDREGR